MSFTLPKDWEKESDDLYVHKTLVRIQRTTFRQQEGWFLIPVDIKEEVVPFESTDEGRDKAFEHFGQNMATGKTRASTAGKTKAAKKTPRKKATKKKE